MAMTNAQNYGNERTLSELLYYQMINRAVSSPGFISYMYDQGVPSSLLIRNQQNSQILPSVHVLIRPDRPVTTREQLMLISAFFGFSKSELGKLFGVARQSIYNWFNNSEVASEHSKKIKCLADIAFEVDPKPTQQIFHVYANEVIKGHYKSLFNYLLDDDIDKDTVIPLSRTIYEMSKERWKRIDAIPKAQSRNKDTL